MCAVWHPAIVVRPDPYFPESAILYGKQDARIFFDGLISAMGSGELEVALARESGDRCLLDVVQRIEAPGSGLTGTLDWSVIATVRDGLAVVIEFFLDRDRAHSAFEAVR
jgi:hypothetical protein